jgi:hypothetical protein
MTLKPPTPSPAVGCGRLRIAIRRVGELAAEVGWSRKRLWSRFRSQIGVASKRAARLVRFDHAGGR